MTQHCSILVHHPESMSPRLLSTLLVQHQTLQRQIASRFITGIRRHDQLHILLAGPPGAGKTHITSLICHQLAQHTELQQSLRIVRFGPAEISVGLLSLARTLAQKLTQQAPAQFPPLLHSQTVALPPEQAANAILSQIAQQLQQCSLLLVLENLDQHFRGMSDADQKQWRAFLQETRCCSTLATTRTLFPEISDRNQPCFGFFDIHHLPALQPAACQQLVHRICRLRRRKQLLPLLDSPAGRSRLQAATVLLKGNPRAWVLLAQALTSRSLKQLTPLLTHTLDALTPVLTQKLYDLSPQQRQLLIGLCDQEGAKTVQQLAATTGVEERCCSRQLGFLREFQLVHAAKRGKESLYDVTDPLLRLGLQPRHQTHHPLELTAAFLKDWFHTNLPDTPADPWQTTPDTKDPANPPPRTPLTPWPLLLAEDTAATEFQRLLLQAFPPQSLNNPNTTNRGGNPAELLRQMLRRSPHDWQLCINRITPLYLQQHLDGTLAAGLVSTIAVIDQDDFSSSQLQSWNTLWQQAGKDRPYLQIALRCLAAAVQVLTSTRPSDRPLFQLPPEIRQLVRPLLTKTLGPVTSP